MWVLHLVIEQESLHYFSLKSPSSQNVFFFLLLQLNVWASPCRLMYVHRAAFTWIGWKCEFSPSWEWLHVQTVYNGKLPIWMWIWTHVSAVKRDEMYWKKWDIMLLLTMWEEKEMMGRILKIDLATFKQSLTLTCHLKVYCKLGEVFEDTRFRAGLEVPNSICSNYSFVLDTFIS